MLVPRVCQQTFLSRRSVRLSLCRGKLLPLAAPAHRKLLAKVSLSRCSLRSQSSSIWLELIAVWKATSQQHSHPKLLARNIYRRCRFDVIHSCSRQRETAIARRSEGQASVVLNFRGGVQTCQCFLIVIKGLEGGHYLVHCEVHALLFFRRGLWTGFQRQCMTAGHRFGVA